MTVPVWVGVDLAAPEEEAHDAHVADWLVAEALERYAAVAASFRRDDERDQQHYMRMERLRGGTAKAERRQPWSRLVMAIKGAS